LGQKHKHPPKHYNGSKHIGEKMQIGRSYILAGFLYFQGKRTLTPLMILFNIPRPIIQPTRTEAGL